MSVIGSALPFFFGSKAAVFNFLDPTNIGKSVQGGFFAGLISYTADGVATHALIVAPRATGASGIDYPIGTSLSYKTTATPTTNTESTFDGSANTAVMVADGIINYPCASFCVGLSLGGFTDWYMPAYLELDIAFENLKPLGSINDTSFGINAYSVPKRVTNRGPFSPGQSSVAAFQFGGAEAFEGSEHWSSSQNPGSTTQGINISFTDAGRLGVSKTTINRVRAFRKVVL